MVSSGPESLPILPRDRSGEGQGSDSVDDHERKREAQSMMLTGVGIGLLGAAGAAIGGAVCPLCIIAAPAMVGMGAFRRWQCARSSKRVVR